MTTGIPPIANPPAALTKLLYPGEAVLWVGSPAPGRYAKQMQRLRTTETSFLSRFAGCALALVLIAPFLLAEHAINSLPSPGNWVASIIGIGTVVGLFVLIWQLSVSSIATARAENTIYAITDRRVIEARPGNTRTYLPGELTLLNIRAGLDDVGDVLFTVETVPDDELPAYDVEHGLIGVEHPHAVGAILRAAFPKPPFVEWIRRREANP